MAITSSEGVAYFWRAVETADLRYQPEWGYSGKGDTKVIWRPVGKPRLNQFDAEASARKYAEYIAAKK